MHNNGKRNDRVIRHQRVTAKTTGHVMQKISLAHAHQNVHAAYGVVALPRRARKNGVTAPACCPKTSTCHVRTRMPCAYARSIIENSETSMLSHPAAGSAVKPAGRTQKRKLPDTGQYPARKRKARKEPNQTRIDSNPPPCGRQNRIECKNKAHMAVEQETGKGKCRRHGRQRIAISLRHNR